jgi:hypothetical protein
MFCSKATTFTSAARIVVDIIIIIIEISIIRILEPIGLSMIIKEVIKHYLSQIRIDK